jgi:hypothetical protein
LLVHHYLPHIQSSEIVSLQHRSLGALKEDDVLLEVVLTGGGGQTLQHLLFYDFLLDTELAIHDYILDSVTDLGAVVSLDLVGPASGGGRSLDEGVGAYGSLIKLQRVEGGASREVHS